jgi:Fungal protein kinase
MMYRRNKDGRVIGILSDFDLAVSMTRSGTPGSAHRAGTAPFMALDLLRPNPCNQDLTHDFESALYIMLWVALGYKGWEPPNGDPLSKWRRGPWSKIYTAKSAFIDSAVIKDLIGLITPDYEVLRGRILSLHMTIRQQKRSKEDEYLFQLMGITKLAMPPMTALEFFELIGPPPPGHEAYSQTSVSCDLT